MAEHEITPVQQQEPTPAANPAQNTIQQPAQQITPTERTFTQAELDAIVGKRVSKALKGVPDEAELSAFRAWKESQQTEQERWNTLIQERDTARNDLTAANSKAEELAREILMYQKGVTDPEDVKYYAYRIGQMVTDTKTFEQAAEEYFKGNQPRGAVRVDMGGSLAGGGAAISGNDRMNALIRGARN